MSPLRTRMDIYTSSLVSPPIMGQRSLLTSGPPAGECSECDLVPSVTSRWQWPPPDAYSTAKEDSTFIDWYTSEGNTDTSPLFHPSSYERGFITSAYAGIFLCTLGIFVNLLLLAMLLSSRRLRFQFLYVQILNIALADLSYIVTVDSFTVYFELHAWRLGAAFCKTWMILDVALPSVSLLGLLLLNMDRIVFAYKTNLYQRLMQRRVLRVFVLFCPWVISCVIVNTLWLGFPAETEEDLPGVCVYGIMKEANVASMLLTVFLPSLIIFVLLIFIFIAGIGEMPSVELIAPEEHAHNIEASRPAHPMKTSGQEMDHTTTVYSRTPPGVTSSMTSIVHAGRQRRFVAALLAVSVVSLALTLPYSAYSQVSIHCDSPHTCQSFVALFQTLSWMKSSVTCARPLLFIVLTDIYLSFKTRLGRWLLRSGPNSRPLLDDSHQARHGLLVPGRKKSYEKITLTQVNVGNRCSRNNATTSVMASTPVLFSGRGQELLDKQAKRAGTTSVHHINEQDNKGIFL